MLDDTSVAHDRERDDDNECEGALRTTAASAAFDGSEVRDGAAVLDAPLGRRCPHGLPVVQDGPGAPRRRRPAEPFRAGPEAAAAVRAVADGDPAAARRARCAQWVP